MKRQYNWKMIGIIGGSALAILIIIILLVNGSKDVVTEEAKIDTLVRTIDVTGKVVPSDEVDLGFSAAGRINSIAVREGQQVSRGQVLATLDYSEVDANLRQAIAERNVSETELNSLTGVSGGGKLDATKRDAYNSVQKALNVSITQIKTNTDSLFIDAQSGRPRLNYVVKDYFFQQTIIQQRVDIGKILDTWSSEVSGLSASNISKSDLEKASKNLNEISSFLANLSKSLSETETSSAVTSEEISSYRATVTAARAAIDTVISDVSSAQEDLRSVSSEVPVQQAKLVASSANIDKYQSQKNNYTIVSPFDGVVVGVEASSGESVGANQTVLSVMTNSDVEVEVFVPEVYMKDLAVGDAARIKFEALGDDFVVGATVVYVESRGVERNGIVTYKTTLALAVNSPDIKTGMTAVIEIDTLVVENILLIPKAATEIKEKVVADVNQVKAKVKVKEDNGDVVEKEITIGRSDSKGLVEVVSGLEPGQKVVVSSEE